MHTDPDESSQLHRMYQERCAFLDDTVPVSQQITLRFDRQSSGWKRSDKPSAVAATHRRSSPRGCFDHRHNGGDCQVGTEAQ